MSWVAVAAAVLAVASLIMTWLRDRSTRARDLEDARVSAALEAFRARAAEEVAERVLEERAIIEEEARRDPPNADLGRDRAAMRERLLRAAEQAGGPAARADLARVLDPADSGDAGGS